MIRWRSLPHLVARFFTTLVARPLRPDEQAEVAGWLRSDAERAMFWDQSFADQRHGHAAASHVVAVLPQRRDLIRAALLHDVGKRHARLGVIGRSLASLAAMVGARPRGRAAAYLDHGPAAAAELEAAGSERIVVDFASAHHGDRPVSIDGGDWQVLQAADRVRG